MSTIPAEVVDLILSNLSGNDLHSPSLVCRAWLPIARSRFTLVIRAWMVPFGRDHVLLDAECTFLPAIRNLIVLSASQGIMDNLPRFSAIRTIVFDSLDFETDIPALPRLENAVLSFCKFPSLESTVNSLNNITASGTLRDLHWDNNDWSVPNPEDADPSATEGITVKENNAFALVSLHLDWYWEFDSDIFPFCFWPKDLTLVCRPFNDWVAVATEYLRALGRSVEILTLLAHDAETEDVLAGGLVNLAPLTQLHTLKLDSALHYAISEAGESHLQLHPFVETILGQIGAPLRCLVLYVKARPESANPSWTQIFSVLDNNAVLGTIPKLEVLVEQQRDGSPDHDTTAGVEAILRASVPSTWLGRLHFQGTPV
ncbi:hypothetical protein MKEN_00217200 [Mycena kentingensis (nom. inval.)]|nr:hypothetical protein MKEN_00217200 [Mycena kentingensis (nom. inval.)]